MSRQVRLDKAADASATDKTPVSASRRSMSSPVAVIEVGSRATRLLVATIGKAGLKVVFSRAEQTHLMEAIRKGPEATAWKLASIKELIGGFRQKATELGVAPDRISVFGTEAIRQLSGLPRFKGANVLAEVKVLDQKSEALCSFIAATMSASPRPDKNESVLVIDQGGGSIELAIGKIGPPIKLTYSVSLQLGHEKLVQTLQDLKLNLRFVQKELMQSIEKLHLPTPKIDRVIVQGSCATKYAWFELREPGESAYRSDRVQGKNYQTAELLTFIRRTEDFTPSQWPGLRAWAEPRDPKSKEFDMVATGIVALYLLLDHFNAKEFVVSSYGTRYGMAWWLALKSSANAASESPPAERRLANSKSLDAE